MNSSDFSDAIKAARKRVEQLRQDASESGSQAGSLAAVALEELQVAFEELHVADEELRQQNEALLAAREALEVERQRYLDLFHAAPDGYVVTDPGGIITEVNVAAGLLCGVPRRFLVGKPLSLFVAEEKRDAFRGRLNQLMRLCPTGAEEFEVHMRQREGKAFDAAIRVAVVPDPGGKVTALRWLIRDNTERKRLEREMLNANAELERRVLERTRELEAANKLKDDLLVSEQEARLEAEAANRGKDEFLATLGHELRTPLNAIIGWTHILSAQPRDEKLIDHGIEVIKRNAVSQSQIVNDILDVSRIITGNLRLELAEVSLSQIVEAVLEALRPTADAKSIQILLTIGPSRVVSGDPVRLQQVVWNLIENAIKFTPNGGRIAITLEYLEEARLTVSDTGDGISPELLPRLFERFRQADTSTTRHGGLGLGLSIVRRLVEVHGGNVVATSPGQGQGATFVVSLPLVEESVGGATDHTSSEDSQPAEGKARRSQGGGRGR